MSTGRAGGTTPDLGEPIAQAGPSHLQGCVGLGAVSGFISIRLLARAAARLWRPAVRAVPLPAGSRGRSGAAAAQRGPVCGQPAGPMPCPKRCCRSAAGSHARLLLPRRRQQGQPRCPQPPTGDRGRCPAGCSRGCPEGTAAESPRSGLRPPAGWTLRGSAIARLLTELARCLSLLKPDSCSVPALHPLPASASVPPTAALRGTLLLRQPCPLPLPGASAGSNAPAACSCCQRCLHPRAACPGPPIPLPVHRERFRVALPAPLHPPTASPGWVGSAGPRYQKALVQLLGSSHSRRDITAGREAAQ